MDAFREHHEDSIRFGYRCFDRRLRKAVEHLPALRTKLAGIVASLRDDLSKLRAKGLVEEGPDRLSQRVVDDLDRLLRAVGLKTAA